MYGDRPPGDLAITRFYTSNGIYARMRRMHEFDQMLWQQLRAKDENGETTDDPGDVVFLQREGKKHAFRYKQKVEGQLREGTYTGDPRVQWSKFREEFEAKVLDGTPARTRGSFLTSLGHFERVVKPARVTAITTRTIAAFVAARRKERGVKPGSILSPATINRDLRHVTSRVEGWAGCSVGRAFGPQTAHLFW
jgi:hypothetical protein